MPLITAMQKRDGNVEDQRISHCPVILHRGQKLTIPAIRGATPRKNHGLPLKIPYPIRADPKTIRKGRHTALIFVTFIVYSFCIHPTIRLNDRFLDGIIP